MQAVFAHGGKKSNKTTREDIKVSEANFNNGFFGNQACGIAVRHIINPIGTPKVGERLRGTVVAPNDPDRNNRFLTTSRIVQKGEQLLASGQIEFIVRTENGHLYGGRYRD